MTEAPPKHPRLAPCPSVRGAGAAILFRTTAFDARKQARMFAPDGSTAHAEPEIGGSQLVLAEAVEEIDSRGPKALGGTADRPQSTRSAAATTFTAAPASWAAPSAGW